MFEVLRRQSVSEEADAERIAGRLSVRGGHGCGHAGELFGGGVNSALSVERGLEFNRAVMSILLLTLYP